jgi:hypothetical protein
MENVEPSEDASDEQSFLFTSMWREHKLKRSAYSSDLNGLLRFLYAKRFMSTAVAESCCLAFPLCEESVDEDLVLKQRLASGLTSIGVSFSLRQRSEHSRHTGRRTPPQQFTALT